MRRRKCLCQSLKTNKRIAFSSQKVAEFFNWSTKTAVENNGNKEKKLSNF